MILYSNFFHIHFDEYEYSISIFNLFIFDFKFNFEFGYIELNIRQFHLRLNQKLQICRAGSKK